MVGQQLRQQPEKLRIAICGGGPGGLGAAIALSALPNVEISLYEQAKELREIGAGIRIGYNCWKMLELLGAADRVKGHRKDAVVHRNGLNGHVVGATGVSSLPIQYHPQRVRRTRLQSALLSKVPRGIIQLNKRLVSLENLEQGGVRLVFQDGTETIVDLVVGADGIRSVVRENIFPDHSIKFTGTTVWRVLIPATAVAHIPDLPSATSWWHGPAGHVFFCPVDNPAEVGESERLFEIAARNTVDPETVVGKRLSWGIPATNERVQSHFTDYDPRVRDALAQVPEGQWREFSAFAGPRLEKLTAWDKVVLIGDASHPLSGAFGSGAAFALEDGWILARAIEHTRSSREPLTNALEIFDTIRSPYYLRMYQYLDGQKQKVQEAHGATPTETFEARLQVKLASLGGDEALPWIYRNDIEDVWGRYLGDRSSVDQI
ncbi:MAG: hypothetical protein M1819_000447 [Sarea resinae]|nr:MAG: hypothetical protein M1819_000447 [Sarea resinae]